MVLFTEREALLLLDMYLRLRGVAENVASNGVLLKAPARAKLTRAINLAAGDNSGRNWTGTHVCVRPCQLAHGRRRNAYSRSCNDLCAHRGPDLREVQEPPRGLRLGQVAPGAARCVSSVSVTECSVAAWRAHVPCSALTFAHMSGFTTSDEGMSKEWWAAIKTQRPKAHVFKGKLPWPYFTRMAMILQDAPYVSQEDDATAQRITELLAAADGDDSRIAEVSAAVTRLATAKVETRSRADASESLAAAARALESREDAPEVAVAPTPRAAPIVTVAPVAVAPIVRHETPKRARIEEETPAASPYTPASKRGRSSFGGASEETSPVRSPHRDSLSRSVEQCSAAAAGMARGFQELVSVFQTQAEKCRELEIAVAAGTVPLDVDDDEASADATCVRTERQVLLSIARSLEKSTQASADMARGYHDLVQHFVRESDMRRLL